MAQAAAAGVVSVRPHMKSPLRIEVLAVKTYAELGIHGKVFRLPAVRRNALVVVRRLVASGCDAADCMTASMTPSARREIQVMAAIVRRLLREEQRRRRPT